MSKILRSLTIGKDTGRKYSEQVATCVLDIQVLLIPVGEQQEEAEVPSRDGQTTPLEEWQQDVQLHVPGIQVPK